MNSASHWRTTLTQPITPIYAANPHVAAVILGGSTGRGHADRYSDVELGVFWHQPPTDTERQQAADQITANYGDLLRLYPYYPDEEAWCDDFTLGRAHPDQPQSGLLLEVVHYTTNFVERTLDEVLIGHNPDLFKQNLIAGVLDGRPTHNAPLIQSWQTRAKNYPDELAYAVVRRHAQIDHFWRWQMWLARSNNLMMLYQSFTQVQNKLLHVLLGLNKVYYFGFKWLDVINGRLTHKPADLLSCLARAYEAPPAEGVQIVTTLVEETYDLIEQHLPDIDVAWLRAVFRYQRPLWDDAPPAKQTD